MPGLVHFPSLALISKCYLVFIINLYFVMGRQLLFGFFSFISSHLVGKICFFHKLLNIMASLDRSCYLFETIIQFFMEWNLFIILILIFAGFCRCQRENICCYGGGLCFM